MIPLSEPNISGNEWKYVKECLDSTWISSSGKFVEVFQNKIEDYTKSKYAIACVNGTSALQVSLKLAGVKPGDEVIVPTLTFIAPVNAIVYNGARPVFMDCDKYYNINSEKTIDFINTQTYFKNGSSYNKKTDKRISAIVPVNIWGNACNLDELVPTCIKRNIKIIEDASESLGTIYKSEKFNGIHTGTIGLLGCLSFNGNKIITTAGGGMILTNNHKLAQKAKYLITQAKDDPVRYKHNEIGYNFRLTNIQAALGVAQLEQLPKFLKCKKRIYNKYNKAINDIEGLSIASPPLYAENNHWMNVLKINSEFSKNKELLIKKLNNRGVHVRPVWILNHTQKPYINCQNYRIEFAVDLFEKSICLPSSTNLNDNDLNYVIGCLNE
mgnify:CR=1 FL=1